MARAKSVLESVPSPTSARAPGKKERKRAVPPRQIYERRYSQTIRSVDLWSVLKVSICFYLCALIVLLTAGVMLWSVASAAGFVSNIEDFIGELTEDDGFRLLSWQVLRASTLLGLVIVCILTVLSVLAAAFYNLFSELIGGIEVTVVEQEQLD